MSPVEALSSSLLSMYEKLRFKNFIIYVINWSEDDKTTWKGNFNTLNIEYDTDSITMAQLYDSFGLQPNSRDIIGHAAALYLNDE